MRAILTLLVLLAAANAMSDDHYSIVLISGFDRAPEYRLLNDEELREMKTSLSAESLLFLRAVSAVKKEWSADAERKISRFPFLAKRSMRVIQTYSERDDAINRLQSYVLKQKKDSKTSPGKEEKIDPNQVVLENAVKMLVAEMNRLSDGKATGAIWGIPAESSDTSSNSEAKPDGKKKKGSGAKDVKFSFAGTITYRDSGLGVYAIQAAPGVLIHGQIPWALEIKAKTAATFGATKEWHGKKVQVAGIANVRYKGDSLKFQTVKEITKLTLSE